MSSFQTGAFSSFRRLYSFCGCCTDGCDVFNDRSWKFLLLKFKGSYWFVGNVGPVE